MRIAVDRGVISYGNRLVLDNFSAIFPAHSVTALVGPSGSGKTSLLASIGGIEGLHSGTIELGEPPNVVEPDAALVAWVPQGNNALTTRSTLDNVLIGPLSNGLPLSEARERSSDALRDVGLGSKLRQVVRELSGGELQRVGFARALASGRQIILADEPSSSLDAANTRNIAILLQQLANRATIVVATHDPVLVEASQYVVHLREPHAS